MGLPQKTQISISPNKKTKTDRHTCALIEASIDKNRLTKSLQIHHILTGYTSQPYNWYKVDTGDPLKDEKSFDFPLMKY